LIQPLNLERGGEASSPPRSNLSKIDLLLFNSKKKAEKEAQQGL